MTFRSIGETLGYAAAGLAMGALSWAVCPLVSGRIEPFDTGAGFLIGQALMVAGTGWIGLATGSFRKTALTVLGVYGGQVLYSAVAVGTQWILLGMITITALCFLPVVGGMLGVGIGKAIQKGRARHSSAVERSEEGTGIEGRGR